MNKHDLLNLILMVLLGIFGGVLAMYFSLKNNWFTAPVVINQKQERIYIEENTALIDSIKETKKSLFLIKQDTRSIPGLVLTSDGLAIALANSLTKSAIVCSINNEDVPCQVLKKDLKQNLALIKIEKDKLSTLGFYDSELDLGKRIYILSSSLVNEGIVKSYTSDLIKTNIRETEPITGNPAFSLDNRIMGLGVIDKNGFVTVIPITIIRSFAGL
jgi:hypothetical protein